MIVLNKGTSIFHVGVRRTPTKAFPDGQVDQVRLMLGANEVNDDDWLKAKDLHAVQHMIGEGTLVEQDNRPVGKRPEKMAIALVKNTFDPELLMKWHEDDTRASVRKAISDQLKECTLSDEDKKKLKGEDEES